MSAACRSIDAGEAGEAGEAGPNSRIATVEAFRAARRAGDLELARSFLAPDPRVWYDAQEGDGAPWTLEGGRWKAWDDHFRGKTDRAGHIDPR